MQPEDARRLREIVDAGRRVQAYVGEEGAAVALKSNQCRSPILYQLVVHGEAAAHVSEDTRAALAAVPWRAMKDFQNLLVHRYWSIHDPTLTHIVEVEMPPVLRAIEDHLTTLGDESTSG
ncbi:HepT-like ribonuclease domain-containing protein [Phycisphaera mikurensis]|uniref:DUF86 domain-containing protein n=1 Tax=Phycisphaera mikurensis (strain NBRC 102666 / KCTC 22515 / FYK2301M01) TaxID=1142394 RepID=I0IG90_PHYMF|nr:HepT-like ribonuclease domain-containing protein [Phycisphaera mikurensis]MBB6440340.1 uncharacterized protein with HEPN domain [Phycisphaera mikurensis]BAM04278.1 hypothetical protein PSMK_21190 [Phycisphaera mikurensis NBRC 102666]